MKTKLFVFLLLVVLAGVSVAQNAEAILNEALKPSPIEKQLRVLTDEIGGRVPGTPAMDKAVEWGLSAFKEAGGDNVHAEPFTIAQGWTEGQTRFQIIAPQQFAVRAVSFGWSPAIPSSLHAKVIYVGEGTAQDFERAGDTAGAIVVATTEVLNTLDDLFAEYLSSTLGS